MIYYTLFFQKSHYYFLVNKEDPPCNNEEKPQETQGSKRPLPSSFFLSDDYYDEFCKPSHTFPSIQKYIIFQF